MKIDGVQHMFLYFFEDTRGVFIQRFKFICFFFFVNIQIECNWIGVLLSKRSVNNHIYLSSNLFHINRIISASISMIEFNFFYR